MTVAEAARYLKRSPAFIRGEIGAGRLMASKVRGTWRIAREEVERYHVGSSAEVRFVF